MLDCTLVLYMSSAENSGVASLGFETLYFTISLRRKDGVFSATQDIGLSQPFGIRAQQ